MNHLISAVLLFICVTCYSQTPPLWTYQIVANNGLSKDENMLHVIRILNGSGYQVAIRDTVNYYIESNRKRLQEFGISYSFHFIVKDKSVTIFGKLTDSYMPNTLSKSVYMQIVNSGPKNSAQRISFLMMHGIAIKISDELNFITLKKSKPDKNSGKEEYDDIYK